MTGHEFTRPGQVAPHLPAPDACMTCGQPEAMHPVTGPQPDPGGLARKLDDLSREYWHGDEALGHAIDELRLQVMALEEILAARWPRSILIRARLRRDLRASVRHSEGTTFAERRSNAIGTGWLARDRSGGTHGS